MPEITKKNATNQSENKTKENIILSMRMKKQHNLVDFFLINVKLKACQKLAVNT